MTSPITVHGFPSPPPIKTNPAPGLSSMNDSAHIDALENDLATAWLDLCNIKDALCELVSTVSSLVQPTTPTPPVHTQPSTNRPSAPPLKPTTPNDFDSACDKGRAFLNSCKLYMSLVPRQFSNNQTRIGWALSYMKSGRASLFADRILRHQSKNTMSKYEDWSEFQSEFIKMFCPHNEGQIGNRRLPPRSVHGRRVHQQVL